MNRREWLKTMVGLAAAGAVGACETAPPQRLPELSYKHLEPLRLDVARIDVADEYTAPAAAPHVEHLFPMPPARALRRWADDRLVAAGTPGRYARFVIQDARVIETELPRTRGVRGAFTTDQTHRYELTLAAALEIREERGNFRNAFASAKAMRSRTTAEGITLNEREKAWHELLEMTMADLNTSLERQIREDLARYLV